MGNLYEVKSVAIFRNSSNIAVYLTLNKFGEKTIISGKITYQEKEGLPKFLLDQHLNIDLEPDPIGKQTLREKIGKDFVATEIDRYQIIAINPVNYETFSR